MISKSNLIRTLLWFTTITSISLSLFFIVDYLQRRDQIEQTAYASAQQQADEAAQMINENFREIMQIADDISDDLTSGALAYTNITQRLQSEVEQRPDIDGLAITFEPFVYDGETRLYQEYIYRENGTFDMLIGASYDYSIPPNNTPDSPQTGWYHTPLNEGPTWNEPFLATGAGKILIEYGVPFYRTDDDSGEEVPAGVVTIDYSIQDMRNLVNSLDLGDTGYGYVITSQGTFLSSPVAEVIAQQTIFDVAENNQDESLAQVGERAINGEEFDQALVDPITGQESHVFIEQIEITGWSLGIVLNAEEFLPTNETTTREQIVIAVTLATFVFCLVALLVSVHKGESRSLWVVATTFSILAIVIIVFVWFRAMSFQQNEAILVTDQNDLGSYLTEYVTTIEDIGGDVYAIPTGVLIQAVQFPDPTEVTVNGYVWQRYNNTLPDSIERGFMFPQRIGEEATLEEISRIQQGEEEVVVWYFGVTLRQQFDTSHFPFDNRLIKTRITPLELEEHVILTPDFNSYSFINPSFKPGLDDNVDINNWIIRDSAFSYTEETSNTSLGIVMRNDFSRRPELSFDISIQRNFVGPFIAYMIPVIVVSLMVYAFLFHSKPENGDDYIMNALNYFAALFFVVAIAHTALRDSIAAVGLTYIEYLYILLYLAIILVTANTFAVVKRPNLWMVRYHNNQLIKLLYWPAINGTLLIVTLLLFVFN